ncbi:MAG: LytR C-terminal domain-containing protein [Patulibacter sp.]|nr:LytR C-terminal domain-containing protein [Patulibacter sp.]
MIAMAILVFSQGRELQRLREWAGTAPERLEELEQRLEHQGQAAAPAARPAAPGKLAPHPGAQAPASGLAPPAPPLAAGVAAATTTAGKPTPPGQTPPAATPPRPVPPGVPGTPSQATRVVPAVAGTPRASTPAGRANAVRQREPEPPKRSVGQVIGVALVGVIVIVGVLFAVGVIGGDTESPVEAVNERDRPEQRTTTSRAKAYSPGRTSVVVLNATGQGGLAKTGSDLLDNKRFATGSVGDYSENGVRSFQDRSTIAYREGRGNRDAAQDIAKHLGLPSSTVRAMSGTIRAAVDGTPKIVVVLGQDYAAKTDPTPADANPTGTTPGGTTTESAPGAGGGTADGTSGATGSTTPDSSITGDVSGEISGDVVADTAVGTP